MRASSWQDAASLLGRPPCSSFRDNSLTLVQGPILPAEDKKSIGTEKSIGLGGGVKTDFGVHAVDGARLGGIWAIRGINYISDHLESVSTWTEEAISEVQKHIDQYMEDKKDEGGISGMMARATDFIGDDLFNLW